MQGGGLFLLLKTLSESQPTKNMKGGEEIFLLLKNAIVGTITLTRIRGARRVAISFKW